MSHHSRPVCYRCFRPRAQCYCDEVEPIDNRTRVLILQHPREQFHPLGTARIVGSCLQNVCVTVVRATLPPPLVTGGFRPGSALLYPGPASRDLRSLAPAERPKTLVVLDGTWHHARTMYRDHAALRQLPQVSFVPRRPTEYRVRREPHEAYVSTVEAVAATLEALEPGLSCSSMLAAFRKMIDLHLVATAHADRKPRHRRERPVRFKGLPGVLTKEPNRIVLVYCEASPRAPGERSPEHRPLVYLTAKRLGDAGVFAQALREGANMAERHSKLLGLDPEHFEHGCSLDQARQRWRSFLRSDDVLIAWNQSTLNLLPSLSNAVPSLALKGVYRGYPAARVTKGALDEVVRGEGLLAPHVAVPGRARERLGQLQAVVRLLQGFAE